MRSQWEKLIHETDWHILIPIILAIAVVILASMCNSERKTADRRLEDISVLKRVVCDDLAWEAAREHLRGAFHFYQTSDSTIDDRGRQVIILTDYRPDDGQSEWLQDAKFAYYTACLEGQNLDPLFLQLPYLSDEAISEISVRYKYPIPPPYPTLFR